MRLKTSEEWDAQFAAEHAEQVANGLHDGECEWEPRFYMCHCKKRRREARGLTAPPTDDLYFPPPDCPVCDRGLNHNGDGWECNACSLTWASDGDGSSAAFTDDYGDLSRCETHSRRGCWHCEQAQREAKAKAARDA